MSRWRSFVKMLYRWPTAAWLQARQTLGQQRMEKELPHSLPRAYMAGKKVLKLLGYTKKYRAQVHSRLLPSAARKASNL